MVPSASNSLSRKGDPGLDRISSVLSFIFRCYDINSVLCSMFDVLYFTNGLCELMIGIISRRLARILRQELEPEYQSLWERLEPMDKFEARSPGSIGVSRDEFFLNQASFEIGPSHGMTRRLEVIQGWKINPTLEGGGGMSQESVQIGEIQSPVSVTKLTLFPDDQCGRQRSR